MSAPMSDGWLTDRQKDLAADDNVLIAEHACSKKWK